MSSLLKVYNPNSISYGGYEMWIEYETDFVLFIKKRADT